MAQGKLSQQVTNSQSTGRVTRTQRVKQQQVEKKAQHTFDSAKAEATRLKEEKFENISFDEYTQEYSKLSPDVQQFFSSPTEITAEKNKKIASEQIIIDSKIEAMKQNIKIKQETYRKYQEWESQYKYATDSDRRERQLKSNRERDRDKEHDVEEAQAQLRYLQQQLGKVAQGYSASDLIGYAYDKADYDRQRKEARGTAQRKFYSKLESGELDSQYKDLGFNYLTNFKKIKYGDYTKRVDKYNKDVAYTNQLQKWAGKVGYENLPENIKPLVNPKATAFQKEYPNEKLQLNFAGQIVGIDSTAYGKSFTPNLYNKRVQQDQSRIAEVGLDQFQQEWKASQFDKEKIRLDEEVRFANIEKEKNKKDEVEEISSIEKLFSKPTPTINLDTGVYGDKKNTFTPNKNAVWLDKQFDKIGWEKIETKSLEVIDNVVDIGKSGVKYLAGFKYPQKFIDYVDEGQGFLKAEKQRTQDKIRGIDNTTELQNLEQEEFSKNFQREFEVAELENIMVYGKDFEQAKEDFAKTDKAKELQQEYAESYAKKYKQLGADANMFGTYNPINPSFWSLDNTKNLRLGSKSLALGGLIKYGDLVLDTPAKTVGTVAVATAGLYYAPQVIKAIPYGSTALSVGFGALGMDTLLDPTKTVTEKVGGLVTVGIAGASLGYSGYKYLNKPYLTTVIEKAPKLSVKSAGSSGDSFNIKYFDKNFKTVIFGKTKIGQVGQAGQRITVTSEWRHLFNEYIAPNKFKFSNLYEGVPANQPAQFMRVTNYATGQSTLVKTQASGYEKAFKYLKNYGWTDAQAKSSLRFTAPRVADVWREDAWLLIGKDKAIGSATFTTRPIVMESNKALGINTRGGRVVQDIMGFKKSVIKSGGVDMVKIKGQTISNYIEKSGKLSYRGEEQWVKESVVAVGKSKYGAEYMGKLSTGQNIWIDPIKYTDLKAITRIAPQDLSLQTSFDTKRVGTTFTLKPSNMKTGDFGGLERTRIYQHNVDWTPINQEPAYFTYVKKGRSSSAIDKAIREMRNIKTNTNVVKDLGFSSGSTTGASTSGGSVSANFPSYVGGTSTSSGLGGGTSGQIFDIIKNPSQTMQGFATPTATKTTLIQKQLMILPPAPTVQAVKLGTLTDIAFKTSQAVFVGQAVQTALQVKLKYKQDFKLKQELQTMTKQDLKTDQLFKTATKLKTAQATKTAQVFKLASVQDAVLKILNPPRYKTPPFRTPALPPFVVTGFDNDLLKKKIKSKKSKNIKLQGLMPDFTTRALGLKSQEFGSVKDALKQMGKIQTGFEIRRGGKIKGYKPIDEKSLIMDLMK